MTLSVSDDDGDVCRSVPHAVRGCEGGVSGVLQGFVCVGATLGVTGGLHCVDDALGSE